MLQGPTAAWTALFLVALAIGQGLRVWLNARQLAHYAAHRDRVPPRFAARISLPEHRNAIAYASDRLRLGQVGIAVDTAMLLALTLGGLLDALSSAAYALLPALPAGVVLLLALMALGALVELPLTLYGQFVIEARYGFNRMTPRLFLLDAGKQALLALAIGAPLIAAVLWLLTHLGAHGWLAAWAVWCAFMVFMMWAFPTFIAPLFNRFEPLPDGPLKKRVEALLARCGFTSRGLFVMDGSTRSAHGNAYFTGTGKAKRIVFFDTLLERLDAAETEAVLAHELGHFHHRHVRTRLGLSFASAFCALALLAALLDAPGVHAALGVSAPTPAATLALVFLVLPALLFPLAPLASLLSRRQEFEADRFAARHADAAALIAALVKLYRDSARPVVTDRWYSRFHDSHPPAALRIAALEKAHA